MTHKIPSFPGLIVLSQVYALNRYLTMLNNDVHWWEPARNDLSLPFQPQFPSGL